LTGAGRVGPATVLFGLAAVTSAVVLVVWQSHLTFFYDDWDPLLHRRGLSADVLLRPHIDHILLATTLVYKAIQATIGMESLTPYAIASTAMFILSATLLFVYMRRRIGEWLALAAVLPVLFLGAAHEDLLWPFQMFFFGAMAAGLASLLVLERARPHADPLACGLLVLSFTFSELAVPFILGAGLVIAQERGPLRRIYVVAVPLVLYAIWYLGWGHTAQSYLSFDNIAHSAPFVLDGLAAGIASLLGLVSGGLVDGGLDWGRPLLLALAVAGGLRVRFGPPLSRWFWVSLVVLISFWLLTAANASVGRPPTASRYQYIGAVLTLLVVADLAAGLGRPRAPVIGAAFAVAVVSVLGNIVLLHDSYSNLRGVTPTVRGGLAGLDIEAGNADPGLVLDTRNSGFNYIGSVEAGPYLSAVSAFGSPAYSEAELADAPERARRAADLVMGAALRLGLRPAPASAATGACVTLHPRPGSPVALTLEPGRRVTLEPTPGARAEVALRRFASETFPVEAGPLSGPAVLAIPRDLSNREWQVQLGGAGPVRACGATPPRLAATPAAPTL
jgi:hypothetical protein